MEQLMEELLTIINSAENQRKRDYYDFSTPWARDMWRGLPVKPAKEGIPFTIAPDNSLWAKILNFDLKEYYSSPLTQLKYQLLIKKYTFEEFRDDTYIPPEVFIWFSVVNDISFFNVRLRFFSDREPWMETSPRLKSPDDLDHLEYPDFYNDGLMPEIHRFYQEVKEITGGRFKVLFPEWVKGVFPLAMYLRGMENLLMDMVDNPEFVHKLMRFLTEARKHWFKQRAEFLNEPIPKGKFYNDEVDVPSIAPYMYREFILPYEQELSEFHGGVAYWHSCGNTAPVMEDISKIPNLELFHVSPYTDLSTAVEIFPPETALDICLKPVEDCYNRTEEEMREKLEGIKEICGDKIRYTIRNDGFQLVNTLEEDVAKIKLWGKVAREVLKE